MVISFRTASAQTGQRYSEVQGATQLKIKFTKTTTVDAHYSDPTAADIETSASTDERSEAEQYTCGRLFRELWSSDGELGFPMPKGCYYKGYGEARELFLLFEQKNGLAANTDYQ